MQCYIKEQSDTTEIHKEALDANVFKAMHANSEITLALWI
jgi:hypothetical protein